MKIVKMGSDVSDSNFVGWVEENGHRRAPRKDITFLDAGKELLDRGYQRRNNEWDTYVFAKPENTKDKLQIALEDHDWTYEMSDAMNMWQRGEEQAAYMKKLIGEIGQEGIDMLRNYVETRGDCFTAITNLL